MRNLVVAGFYISAAMAGVPVSAEVGVVPDASFHVHAYTYNFAGPFADNQSSTNDVEAKIRHPFETADATARIGSTSLEANLNSADSGGSANLFSGSSGVLDYYFITNGTFNTVAPLFISYSLSAKIYSPLNYFAAVYAKAGIKVTNSPSSTTIKEPSGGSSILDSAIEQNEYSGITSISPIFNFTVITGSITRIHLSVDTLSAGRKAEVNAYADPFIEIDPAFLSTHPGYSLQFSAGVSNKPISPVVGVPEPYEWMLMLIGLFATGTILRRKQAVTWRSIEPRRKV